MDHISTLRDQLDLLDKKVIEILILYKIKDRYIPHYNHKNYKDFEGGLKEGYSHF